MKEPGVMRAYISVVITMKLVFQEEKVPGFLSINPLFLMKQV